MMSKPRAQPKQQTTVVRMPTVSRVCADRTVIELIYDAHAHKTGLVVSRFGGLWNIEQEVRIETGEVLVPYSPGNNLIANDCVLLPSKPVEYGSKQELLADIQSFLHRYVDLSPLFEQIATHYVLLSWVHDAFNELPYLRLRGDYGTGKTRGLMAIGSLCYRPFFASGASTVSPIFHALDAFGGTLIQDEADLPYSDARADLVKIFNNGTVRGMPVLRTVQNKDKEFNPRAFKVFGPKIIAMRGSFEDRALESRFLTEETGMRSLRGDIPIQTPTSLKIEALELRNRLLHYRLCHRFDIQPDVSAIVAGIEPRLNQIALPLLSLIDDPDLRRDIQQALVHQNSRALWERSELTEARVLAVLRAAFAKTPGKPVQVRAITDGFNTTSEAESVTPITNKSVGHVLRTRLRIATCRIHGVYVVPHTERDKTETLAARYGLAQ